MTTRAFESDDAAAAARIVELVRERPTDLVDPFPPSTEMEMLVDAGARGKHDDAYPRVFAGDAGVLGYGAVDVSKDMRCAQLIGPVVHPDHRRRGAGKALLEDLMQQARRAGQKTVRAVIGTDNHAAKGLLKDAGFTRFRDRHTCLRLERPEKLPSLGMDGIEVRPAEVEDDEALYHFTHKLVPRSQKQTRSLMKTDAYKFLLAVHKGKIVGFVEVDARYGDTATLEHLEGKDHLVAKGLGNLLLVEGMRAAFTIDRIRHLDLVVHGTDKKQLAVHEDAGFVRRHELVVAERNL